MNARILGVLLSALSFGWVAPALSDTSAPVFSDSAGVPVLCASVGGEFEGPAPEGSLPCGPCSATPCKKKWIGATCSVGGQTGTCGGLQIGPDPLMCTATTYQCECLVISE